jgi:Domain of unknown function (DUF6265)
LFKRPVMGCGTLWRMQLRFIIALALLSLSTGQQKPDLSGSWAAEAEPATGTAKPTPPSLGPQLTIDHKGQSLMLTRTFAGNPATINYVLDGTETSSRMPGRLCEPDSGGLWTAAWEGDGVAITMVGAIPPNGQRVKMDVKNVLRLESPDVMRVEQIVRLPNQAEPRTTSTRYKRTAAPTAPVGPQAEKAGAKLSQVAWISGVWVGTAGTSTVEERWTPGAGGAMMAISRTMRNGNPSGFEFLCIVERDGGLVYQAMPNGRSPATDFRLTKIDADNAIFENPAHDFPKMIRYTRKADGSLEAVVSDGKGKGQTLVFKREGAGQ